MRPLTLTPNRSQQAGTGTDFVDQALTKLKTAEHQVLLDEHTALTGPELVEAIQRATGALDQAGVTHGTVVGLLFAPNVTDMIIARWAAHRLGATVVHLRSANPRTDEQSLPLHVQADVLAKANVDVVVVDAASAERGHDLRATRPTMKLVQDLHGPLMDQHLPGGRLDNTAVIDFTSGTTSAPRMVDQTFGSRMTLQQRLAASQGPGHRRFVSVTPISHTTAPMLDATLSAAGTVVVLPAFTVDSMIDQIRQGMTETYLAMPHLYELIDDERLASVDLSRIQRIIYSGTPASVRRIQQAREIFGPALVQVYGTTETGGISALSVEDHAEPSLHDTVGQPFPWVEIQVRDATTGVPLPHGEEGEICVRTDTGMRGYIADDQTTAETIDDAGWIRTGDIGYLDELGMLRLRGRQKGVVKTGGLKIYPESVETILREHPDVREAVVLGVADGQRREHLYAVLNARGSSKRLETELSAKVHDALGPTHVPEQYIFWSGIPLTHSGKPNRGFVRKLVGGQP